MKTFLKLSISFVYTQYNFVRFRYCYKFDLIILFDTRTIYVILDFQTKLKCQVNKLATTEKDNLLCPKMKDRFIKENLEFRATSFMFILLYSGLPSRL